jgi:hypothetical protein
VIPDLQWLATLDSHTCLRCAPRDKKRWKNNKAKTPIGHDMPFMRPPIHYNDRCQIVPITRFSNMNIGTRASTDGQVSAKLDFEDWLSRRSEAQQDAQLGKGRAQMFRDKKITLQDLLDGSGRPLKLKDLTPQ